MDNGRTSVGNRRVDRIHSDQFDAQNQKTSLTEIKGQDYGNAYQFHMAKYERFEDLPVWKEAACLYNDVADFLEQPQVPLTGAFRNQLDRAALSISNNIAEGFERTTTAELQSFISIARGAAAEVRSMLSVVRNRPKLKQHAKTLLTIQTRAESCGRQLGAWSKSIERLPFEGKRRLPDKQKTMNEVAKKAAEFRTNFLKNLKPEHPLYNSPDARSARGEKIE